MIQRFAALAAAFALLTAGAGSVQAQAARPGADAVRRDCTADYRKFCIATVPGGGRGIKCMLSHQSQLSPRCKMAVDKYRAANPKPPRPAG